MFNCNFFNIMAGRRAIISSNDKQRIYDAFLRGEDYLRLAEQINIKRQTAYGIVRRAESREGTVALQRGGQRPCKIDDEMKEVLREIVIDHPAFTLHQINSELQRRLPDKPQISRTTIADLLEACLIFTKNLETAPAERNSESTKQARQAYAQWFFNEGVQKELIFIDEAGVNLHVKRTRGRAPNAQRAVRTVNGRRGPNFTICFGVSNQRGLVHHIYFEGGMKAEKFVRFLEDVSRIVGNVPATFLFDNARSHVRATKPVEENGPSLLPQHSVKHLPPYSPMLSCVEHAISAYKAELKKTLEESRPLLLQMSHQERMVNLAQQSEAAVHVITANKCANWFRRTQTFLPACLNNEDIVM